MRHILQCAFSVLRLLLPQYGSVEDASFELKRQLRIYFGVVGSVAQLLHSCLGFCGQKCAKLYSRVLSIAIFAFSLIHAGTDEGGSRGSWV